MAGFQSHQERTFKYIFLSEITAKRFSSCPAVVDIEGGPKVAISEADLEDYAGLWLTGADDSSTKLVGKFPAYPLKEDQKNDRNVLVAERADHLQDEVRPDARVAVAEITPGLRLEHGDHLRGFRDLLDRHGELARQAVEAPALEHRQVVADDTGGKRIFGEA